MQWLIATDALPTLIFLINALEHTSYTVNILLLIPSILVCITSKQTCHKQFSPHLVRFHQPSSNKKYCLNRSFSASRFHKFLGLVPKLPAGLPWGSSKLFGSWCTIFHQNEILASSLLPTFPANCSYACLCHLGPTLEKNMWPFDSLLLILWCWMIYYQYTPLFQELIFSTNDESMI